HVEPEAVRPEVAKRHLRQQPHAGAAEPLTLELQHDALELDRVMRVAATLQDYEPGRSISRPRFDDEVTNVGEEDRDLMLRALPRRDERRVRLIALDRDHE